MNQHIKRADTFRKKSSNVSQNILLNAGAE